MIEIKVFGTTPPCFKCKEMEKRAHKVAEKFPGQISVAKFDAMSDEGTKYGIMITPTTVVNEKIVAIGKLMQEGELEKLLKKELENPA